MLIISHRGAAALAPENTIASIEAAVKAGATHIEFDVRATKDYRLVLMHDESLERTTGNRQLVENLTLDQVSELETLEGHHIPTIEQAIVACKHATAVIEGKGEHWSKPLVAALSAHPGLQPYVISYSATELSLVHNQFPRLQTFLINKNNPFMALRLAKNNNFSGVDLIYWLYNPLTYALAKKSNLKMIAFTVPQWYTPLMRRFYPEVAITVNDPTPFIRNGTPTAST